ncbi:MAG: hypothetical protein GWN51_02270, partial [Gemmatimonadetes bacterium]|nr:hypothetical protein [Gemmatimonadota bacterium]NIT65847.1 hypothetical protein [Gemmatimonadota bacterium]NIV22477.1 hypothetical protein [Gemmatimonadota bacterium]NIW74312.1 hypothetical protein [Gemmatimonadota bacterium]NIY34425.1 hypothetical protein [Gemmatimonadota bacterium]
GILPEIGYPIALIFYLTGVAGTAVLAWFHGERGPQRPPAMEIWLQIGLFIVAVSATFLVVRTQRAEDMIAGSGLDPRRVAVLYFDDLSPDADLGFLADGLSEALIDQLS